MTILHRSLILSLLASATLLAQDLPDTNDLTTPALIVGKGDLRPAHNEPIPGVDSTAPAIASKKDNGQRSAIYSVGDTPPVLTDFYWGNQGSCVANTNADGTITLFHPGAAGLTFNWCVLVKPLPVSSTYTVIMGYRGHLFGKASSLATVLFDTATGKFVVNSIPGSSDSGAAAIASWKMNNYTTYAGSAYFNYNNAITTGGVLPQYVRLKSDGTTRTVAVSHSKDGPWLTINAVPAADFVNLNPGGFFGYALRGTGDGMASMMVIYHESVTP